MSRYEIRKTRSTFSKMERNGVVTLPDVYAAKRFAKGEAVEIREGTMIQLPKGTKRKRRKDTVEVRGPVAFTWKT